MTEPVRPPPPKEPGLFDANPRAVIGDNRPPPYDPVAFEEKKAQVLSFVEAAGQWLDLQEITDDEQAGYLADFVSGARKKKTEVENWRKAAKEPHRLAAAAVDDAAKPLTEKLEASITRALHMSTAWSTKKQREADERAAEARRVADEARAQAERERQAAIARNDISGEVDAEHKAKEAEEQARAAQRMAQGAAKITSASGGGRTISPVKVKTAKITNIRVAFMAVQDDPAVVEAVQAALNRKIRAAGFKGTVPGIDIIVEEKAR